MMNTSDISIKSDAAILKNIGEFIRHHRLSQNKTQNKLAEEAGINRTTLVEFEKGKRSNTITLIQLLRALDKLYVLENFEIKEQISPLKLAKIEKKKRKRASRVSEKNELYNSEW
ncbi:MAG: helix-turn-helix transcriptional regulator [Ignavibacteriae bacterium]|nr:XRE family transcriptional regulator [Ignavibacteriota bacterium]NOH00121.1 helix-turn-helix transcriptional regulator [Ignavibacteriota bacterium]